MATGFLHGKVGGRVYYVLNGSQVVRTLAAARNPRTAAQQWGRAAFGMLSRLAACLKHELKAGLAVEARRRGMGACHLFVSLNRAAAGPEGMDYSALQVACGPLQEASYGVPRATALRVEVPVTATGANQGGMVFLLAYAPSAGEGWMSEPLPMRGGVGSLNASVAAGVLMYAALNGRE